MNERLDMLLDHMIEPGADRLGSWRGVVRLVPGVHEKFEEGEVVPVRFLHRDKLYTGEAVIEAVFSGAGVAVVHGKGAPKVSVDIREKR